MIILQIITIIAVTAALAFVGCKYYYTIMKPVAAEHPKRIAWEDFVEANIESCKNTLECNACVALIELFDKKFRGKIPADVFNNHIEIFWNRLDTKYKSLQRKEGISVVDRYLENLQNERL